MGSDPVAETTSADDDLGGRPGRGPPMLTRGAALARPALGFLALFSGIALLLNILFRVDLRIGLAMMALVVIGGIATVVRRAPTDQRRSIIRTIGYGAVAGVLATLAYDAVRVVLAEFDPSPYRPYEAIMRFGQLLLASQAADAAVLLVGGLYHVLNGSTFGIAFMLLFARDGHIELPRIAVLGTAWGLFLEVFQLALYPNWLGIRYLNEFVSISATGHIAYGLTLALVGRWFLRRAGERDQTGSLAGRVDDE
jgi:hypothetical protein